MATPRVRYHPPLTRFLVEQKVFAGHPFTLIDIGASGGIEPHWHVFGEALVAIGFEPLIAEVQRLRLLEWNPKISYIPARVTGQSKMEEEHERIVGKKIELKNNQWFFRTSAARAIELLKMDYVKSVLDPSGTGAMSNDRITLDQFFSGRTDVDPDFIKIDTDGYDYDVLCGGDALITSSLVLGLFVECQFHGPVHQDANLFCNIDQFLRARGYSLFDMELSRYSRAALPKPFVYELTAQTHGGQVLQGDALYLRDAAAPDYEKMWGIHLPPQKLLKLACIFELYGLEDCAAELLQNKRHELGHLIDVEHCLNLLTPEFGWKRVRYQEYFERFEQNVSDWFPSHYTSKRALGDAYRRGNKFVRRVWNGLRRRFQQALRRVLHRFIISIPDWFWTHVAPWLAQTRPLAWHPGWKFGAGDFESNWRTRSRYKLWIVCHEYRRSIPVAIRWFDGLRVTLHLGNDISLCLYVAGTYEPNEFMFLSQILRPSMVCIDIGANDGLYTLFLSKRVGPTGRVIALEPSAREFRRLKANLRLNHLTNVRALQAAASEKEGVGSLKIAGFGHEGLNTLGGFAYDNEQASVEEVALVTLDDLAQRESLTRVDLIKIDVEGGEMAVLQGAQDVLNRFRPMIQFELLDAALRLQGTNRENVCDLLRGCGYRFYVFGPQGWPAAVHHVEVDGANVVAVHQQNREVIEIMDSFARRAA